MPETRVSVDCWVSTNQYRVNFLDPTMRQSLNLRQGVLLIVSPLDKRKVKTRGRLCRFLERRDGMAWVEYLDTGDQGRVHWADLDYAPKETASKAEQPAV